MNPAREWERIAIEAVRKWVADDGEIADDSATNGPDFRISYHDGRSAIGEVGWATDQIRRQQWGDTLRQPSPQHLALPIGSGSWLVELTDATRVKKTLAKIPALIANLAGSGSTSLEICGDWPRTDIAQSVRQLGISRIAMVDAEGPHQLVYFLPGVGGSVRPDPNLVVDWVEAFLRQPSKRDICDKLQPFGDVEKHVFLIVGDAAGYEVQELVQRFDVALPTQAPELPDWVTHLWLLPEWRFDSNRSVGLYEREAAWSNVPIGPQSSKDVVL